MAPPPSPPSPHRCATGSASTTTSPPTSAPTPTAPHRSTPAATPTPSTSPTGPAIDLYTAGGLDGGTLHDRPFVRFNVVALTGTVAEATAYALRSVLAHAAGAALGLAADPSDVRLTGADTAPPLWAPDPDTNRPRYVVTSTLTVQAVGI
jgi:hypothetical protein